MPKIIALYSPYPQCGKSTVANLITKHGFKPIKFADPLKAMLRMLLLDMGVGISEIERMIEGDLKESPIHPDFPSSITPRHLMKTLGTEWGRDQLDKDFWIKIFRAKYLSMGLSVVVDDMRFQNECDMIRSFPGSFIVKVNRPDIIKPEGVLSHPSEGGLNHERFDYVIENDGTLDDLRGKVVGLMRKVYEEAP